MGSFEEFSNQVYIFMQFTENQELLRQEIEL